MATLKEVLRFEPSRIEERRRLVALQVKAELFEPAEQGCRYLLRREQEAASGAVGEPLVHHLLAQCLVEMQTSAELNTTAGKSLDVYGIVTNGQGWQFYRLDSGGTFFETGLFSSTNTTQLLGMLDWLFARCTEQLEETL